MDTIWILIMSLLRRRMLLAASMQSDREDKIVNKLSYSIGRMDRITCTFEYPVESDVAIYFLANPTYETDQPITITKGKNTTTQLTDAFIENGVITITRIVPDEDSVYIYTW